MNKLHNPENHFCKHKNFFNLFFFIKNDNRLPLRNKTFAIES